MAVEIKQLYAVDDFEAFIVLPENEDRQFELIDGEMIEVSPRLRHGLAGSNLHGELYAFITARGSGRVMFEVDHRLPHDQHNTRRPDISYITHERLVGINLDAEVPFMPDLAVEIKSPSNYVKGLRGLREKALYSLENGSRLVWLIFPDSQTAEVGSRSADGTITLTPLGKDGTLDGGDVLPGFTMTLADVFR